MKGKLFFCLAAAFIVFTVIGTLSHEAGHSVVAKFKGYQPAIHYGYTSLGEWPHTGEIERMNITYLKELKENKYFPERKYYEAMISSWDKDDFWIRLGGPLQTMLTGAAGFLLIIIYRKKIIAKTELNLRQWLLIFLSLFWLRQVANAFVGFVLQIKAIAPNLQGDELKLATYLGWPVYSICYLTASVGLAIALIVIFKFIPRSQRVTFIVSGLVGGIAGYILWLYIAGPVLMP